MTVNLIMRRYDLAAEIDCLVKHRVEFVITSVGAPDAALGPLHEIGCTVFADVASVRHAQKAVAAGVDGLILLTAGAGGQTGWANGTPMASPNSPTCGHPKFPRQDRLDYDDSVPMAMRAAASLSR